MDFNWLNMQSRHFDWIVKSPFSRNSKILKSGPMRSSFRLLHHYVSVSWKSSKKMRSYDFLIWKRMQYKLCIYSHMFFSNKKMHVEIMNRDLPHRLVLFLNPFEPHDWVHGDQLPQSIHPWPTTVSCSPWSGVHSTISPIVFAKIQSRLSTSTEPWIVVLSLFWNPTPHFSPLSCLVKQLWYPQDDQTLKMCSLSTLNFTASNLATVDTSYSSNNSWILEFFTW